VPSAASSGVVDIALGYRHALALKADGTVVAWGTDFARVETGQSIVPVGLSDVKAIAAGALHSLALKNDGTVVAWGCGVSGGAWDFDQCNVT